MKLNRKQLQKLINEEVELIHSGQLNELFGAGALENWITTLGGHAVVGDALALIKAFTIDAARLAKDFYDLLKALEPFGGIGLTFKDSPEMDMVIDNLSQATPEQKEDVKTKIYELADMVKTFLISLVSSSPDAVISGPTAAALTVLSPEKIFMDGTGVLADFMDKIKTLPGGKGLTWLAELASYPLGGPMAIFIGDPLTTMRNLGRLMNATSEESSIANLATSISQTGQTATNLNVIGFGGSDAPALTEARLTKLAGIK